MTTQMLLFDAPATTVAPIVPDAAAASVVPVTRSAAAKAESAAAAVAVERTEPTHREGLNHMGDLARLVILRYELAAKRRAATARRRAR